MKFELSFPDSPPPAVETDRRIPKLTAQLVLGHVFEGMIAGGLVKDYAAVGRLAGLSRARVTQIVNLTLLCPTIQEEILTDFDGSLSKIPERLLRSILVQSDWEAQKRLVLDLRSGIPRTSFPKRTPTTDT